MNVRKVEIKIWYGIILLGKLETRSNFIKPLAWKILQKINLNVFENSTVPLQNEGALVNLVTRPNQFFSLKEIGYTQD